MGSNFGEEILGLISPVAAETGGSSFTALLELPPTQAAELLHSPEERERERGSGRWDNNNNNNNNNNNSYNYPLKHCSSPVLPSNAELLERASRLSVFACEEGVKREPLDCFDPTVDDEGQRSGKRKEREKGKDSKKKKSKTAANGCKDDDEKLPYVHVRARRGQATDSHSLAERARREKINARMKLLQELVPGCNKISGTAMVLDEIISHVQSLQRQVEFLSMRLATVNPRIDFDIDSLLAAQGGSSMDCNFQSMVMPLMWPDGQVQYPQLCNNFDGLHIPEWGKEEKPMFISPDNSLLSYVSSTNSASLNLNQLKKET